MKFLFFHPCWEFWTVFVFYPLKFSRTHERWEKNCSQMTHEKEFRWYDTLKSIVVKIFPPFVISFHFMAKMSTKCSLHKKRDHINSASRVDFYLFVSLASFISFVTISIKFKKLEAVWCSLGYERLQIFAEFFLQRCLSANKFDGATLMIPNSLDGDNDRMWIYLHSFSWCISHGRRRGKIINSLLYDRKLPF